MTAVIAAVLVSNAAVAHAGPRACLREAKADAKDCAADCKEAFQTAKDACLNRDHACVEVCRANRSQCRLDSGIDAALEACSDALEARRTDCRNTHPPGDVRDRCIDAAQVDAFECRDAARELAHPLLKQCRKAFRACAKACPAPDPSGPPVDAKACIRNAKAALLKTCTAGCREDFQIAKDDCRNRDHACMEACRADRTACRAPVREVLESNLAICAADREAGIDGCEAQYPPPRDEQGEIAFDQCVDGVQVVAFVCRDEAHEAARPGFQACKQAFRTCVTTNCPVLTN